MSGLVVDTRCSCPNDEILKRICRDERSCSYTNLQEEETNDYWYDGDNNGFNCAGYTPPARELQRLNHSVDSSCRSLKPIISLPSNPPKSAPPIGGGLTSVENIENQPTSSGVIDIEEVTEITNSERIESGGENSESAEVPAEASKKETESNDLISRPIDLNFTDTKSAACDSDPDSLQKPANELKLCQSYSTPGTALDTNLSATKKESEYRRFKSEGSTVGVFSVPAPEMEVSIDDFSPVLDQKMALPNRITLEQPKNSQQSGPSTKLCHTEQVRIMHALKQKLQKYQGFIDKAFETVAYGNRNEQILEGCSIVKKVMSKSGKLPVIGHDLHSGLCDYMRERRYLDIVLALELRVQTVENARFACAEVIAECLSQNNRQYILERKDLKLLLANIRLLNKGENQQRVAVSIMGQLFRHTADASYDLIDIGVLDYLVHMCSHYIDVPTTLEQIAVAFANVTLYSCQLSKKQIILKKVPEWLFFLASQSHQVTCYYACLAVCVLASTKQTEAEAIKSGALAFVEPFLEGKRPAEFIEAETHTKHAQGKSKDWLRRLLPLLNSKCREARSIASFHFAMEARIKKEQEKLEVFEEIGAIVVLKEVASSPDEVAAKFVSEALTLIGEEVPYKLSQQVPCWSVADVQYWVKKIGFEKYADAFAKNMVDGDLLLLITEEDLKRDIQISSGLLRKRFMRELESLKIAADYGGLDETHLDQFLMSLCPEFSIYTYQMLSASVNRPLLPLLTDEMMKNECGMRNPVHRLKLKQALQNSKHIEDIEISLLSKQIDVFISYRRSTGNQLASLIKVLLQLRGYKVFIDVDKLYAGKFDSSLLKSIQAAKHFVLVLTPHCFDRLLNDDNCDDWIHKELVCAFKHEKNVIPIFDQHFEFPTSEKEIPADIRHITKYNGVRWVHDYQDACMDKVERFIKGELNRSPNPLVVDDQKPIVGQSMAKVTSFSSSVQSELSNQNDEVLNGMCNDHLFNAEPSCMPDKIAENMIEKPSSTSHHDDARPCTKSLHNIRHVNNSLKKRPPKLGDTVSSRNGRSPPSTSSHHNSAHCHTSMRRHVSAECSKGSDSSRGPRWTY